MSHAFIDWNADQWQLYRGRDAAAAELTATFNTGVRTAFLAMADGTPPKEAVAALKRSMHEVMQRHEAAGATDSDPRGQLALALERTFGDDLAQVTLAARARSGP